MKECWFVEAMDNNGNVRPEVKRHVFVDEDICDLFIAQKRKEFPQFHVYAFNATLIEEGELP